VERLLGIYGGHAVQIARLAAAESHLAYTLDDKESVIAAEVVFALRQEFAVNLTDIVHRRLMIGLSADQGLSISDEIAEVAGRESNWSSSEQERQLAELREYNARLRP
jgi:glycerol-3-phosphate dehydrogenase